MWESTEGEENCRQSDIVWHHRPFSFLIFVEGKGLVSLASTTCAMTSYICYVIVDVYAKINCE